MPSPPRLVFIADLIAPGDARYLKLRRSYAAAGFETMAVAPSRPGRPLHETVTAIAPSPPSLVSAIWSRAGQALAARVLADAMSAEAARLQPDVIHVFDPEALPAALAVRRRTGARLIYDAHEFHQDEHPDAPARCAWVRRMETKAAPDLDAFVTVNASIARLYREAQPRFPAALVVHNAVDPPPAPADDGRLRRAAGLGADARILLYQGGLAPHRGIERLIAAAPLLAPPWTLVLMGAGPLDTGAARAIAPAPHAELPAWTVGAALGAALYEDHGLNQRFCSPNKLWEYAAVGVPILASDLPEIARVVRGHATGVLVAPDAPPAAIAAAINALDPEQRARLGQSARAFSLQETWSAEAAPLVARALQLANGR